MKNKKGFTLIEILTVIGLIGIILIIAIPAINGIRKSIKERQLATIKEAIVSAAEVYAQNNQSLFPKEGGIIQIPVRTLVYYGYINEDSTDCDDAIGCVMNPVNNTSMNNEIISIKKIKSVTQATFGEVNEHVITFHANGATSVGGSSDFISIGCDTFTNSACTIRVPSIERDGFTKVGFGESTNSTTADYLVGQDILFNDNISNNDVKSDYYAITSKGVIVTFNASTNGGTLTTGAGTLDKNCTIQNQQNTCSVGTSDPGVNDRAGYTRKAGWYNNSSGGNVVTTRSFSSNQTLYAQWNACQKGYYALAGATSCTACSIGAYSASTGSSSCAVCGAGKTTSGTGTQASTSCTDCSNKAHVATWETPTWSPNSVTNLCKIKTCESGYKISNNTCVSDYTFAFNYTGNFRVNNETTVRTGDYSFTTSDWKVYLLTNGTLTVSSTTSNIDAFLVGGGGSGGVGGLYAGGGGGAGGYTKTQKNISLNTNTGYKVTIGNGGAARTGNALNAVPADNEFSTDISSFCGTWACARGGAGYSGDPTSAFGYSAAGGGGGGVVHKNNNKPGSGGSGGSGGGSGRRASGEIEDNPSQCPASILNSSDPWAAVGNYSYCFSVCPSSYCVNIPGSGNGGSYGSNGYVCRNYTTNVPSDDTIHASSGGSGQGRTTCEFDEGTTSGCNSGVQAYAGGGGGGPAFIGPACGWGSCSHANSYGMTFRGGAGGAGGGGAGKTLVTSQIIDGGKDQVSSSGETNTGGGGGGAPALTDSSYNSTSGAGGSGVVVIRNKR